MTFPSFTAANQETIRGIANGVGDAYAERKRGN